MDAEELIDRSLTDSAHIKLQVARDMKNEICEAARLIGGSLAAGGKLLLCGNGGSAADAQHIAGELVGRFLAQRLALSAIALTSDTSILTAVGNDFGFDKLFSRQVEAHARPGDVLMGISTSGQSRNVVLAMEAAKAAQCKTVALVGATPGAVGERADVVISIPSTITPRVQECHIAVAHVICDIVERRVVAESSHHIDGQISDSGAKVGGPAADT